MILLRKAALWLYTIMNRSGKLIPAQVRSDLDHLYPVNDKETTYKDFYVEKLEKCILICIAGIAFAVLMGVRAAGERKLEQDGMLRRGGILEEEENVVVEGSYNDRRERFSIRMEPLRLNEAEAAEAYSRFAEALPDLIAGDNTSLEEVRSDLRLSERYDDYPFYVEWRSRNTDVVSSSGVVHRMRQDEEAMLIAQISYLDAEWREELHVTVKALELTPQEYEHEEMNRFLQELEQTNRDQEYWSLPEQIGEYSVKWTKPVDDYSLFLGIGACVISVLVYFMGDRDLHQDLRKQRERMKREYPDIVHKLALYLGAGMTLRGAFEKLGQEYEQQKEAGKRASPGYEQILYTCRELRSGVSESNAYERFGRRTGLQEYIRLSTLMVQNLKKGSATLLPRLREEAERSMAERIQLGRKLGEEASTRLLVPMVMMLGVVMLMVVLPAFGSMGM